MACFGIWSKARGREIKQGLGRPVGGHEYELVAYDSVRRRLGFWNSWGASWGVGGRFWIRQTDFARLLADGGDATVPQGAVHSTAPAAEAASRG